MVSGRNHLQLYRDTSGCSMSAYQQIGSRAPETALTKFYETNAGNPALASRVENCYPLVARRLQLCGPAAYWLMYLTMFG